MPEPKRPDLVSLTSTSDIWVPDFVRPVSLVSEACVRTKFGKRYFSYTRPETWIIGDRRWNFFDVLCSLGVKAEIGT